MRRRIFFTGMYTFLAHKAKNGINDQCLEHIASLAGLPQEDRRLVSQAGVVLTLAGSRWDGIPQMVNERLGCTA